VKVLLLAEFDSSARRLLESEWDVREAGWAVTDSVITALPSDDEILALASDVAAIIVPGELSTRVMAGCPELRVIGCCRGDPRGIDLEFASRRGIAVVYAPARNAASVADLTLAFILCLARQLLQADAFVRGGYWTSWDALFRTTLTNGLELEGQRLGLVGCGAVGSQVARRANAFGMRVQGYDPYCSSEQLALLGIEKASLDDVLRESDFVSIHCKLSAETTGLIGAEQLAQMKPTAYLINTARAAIVDKAALYSALVQKKIAGAALDVFWQEPPLLGRPFLDIPEVVLTPHIGGATVAVEPRTARMIVQGVMAVLRGERPDHLANPEVWKK